MKVRRSREVKGVVVSIVSNYGFIKDAEGVSYYFNPKKMALGQKYTNLRPNSPVEFTAKAGPRGMIADDVSMIRMYHGTIIPDKFITTRGNEGLREDLLIDLERLVCIRSRWFKSPNDAISEAKEVAIRCGANCLLETEMHKSTFSQGNYQYTMHSYSGHAGVYGKVKLIENEAAAAKNNAEARFYTDTVVDELDKAAAELNEARARQEQGSNTFMFCFIAIFSILLLLLFFG